MRLPQTTAVSEEVGVPQSIGTPRTTLVGVLLMLFACGTAVAQDDGPRVNWKAMDGANVVAFQYLPFDGDTSNTRIFDPLHYTYPESQFQANLFLLTFAHHFTLFNRTAVVGGSLLGGNIDVESVINPFGVGPSVRLKEAAHGFGDPVAQLTVNLAGAPAIRSLYDVSKYEPKAVLDLSVIGNLPIGEYDSEKVLNLGLNRWWTRIGLPFTYHIGPYVPGYRTSIEVTPSVFVFASNDDFLGRTLDTDPLFQIEGHVTRDFAAHLFGSFDVLYRNGALPQIDHVDFGEKLDLLSAGFTLDYTVNDNFGVRVSYHSLVGGGSDIEGDMFRINFNFGWHPLIENIKKLGGG